MTPAPTLPDNSQVAIDEKGFFVTSWFTFFSGIFRTIQNNLPTVLNITLAADFPVPKNAQQGLTQALILAGVTDNDPTRTNTGQSFSTDDYIVWNGTAWVLLN